MKDKKTKKKSEDLSSHNSSFLIHNSARRRALVVGSVAYDVIFGIHGKIQDEILIENGKLGRQNLMFTAKDKKHFFGGTGGNISYGLGKTGMKPLLFSVAGKDFEGEFENHLKTSGVDLRVVVKKDEWTATFYGMSDEETQQIGVYQPNAYAAIDTTSLSATISEKDFSEIGVAIFSAGTGKSIFKQMKELRARLGNEVVIIFDPGQVISIFYDKKPLEETLALSDIFIGNEVEFKQMEGILGYTYEKLLQKGLKAVVKTVGEKGSVIYEKNRTTEIKAVKAKKVVETTGAGDAYRAGLIYGLLNGLDLAAACRIGAKLGAKNVETVGGQAYEISKADLKS
ncbi:MAG: PfkB family carbohydrate kinase [Patescibacteria group bacterium]